MRPVGIKVVTRYVIRKSPNTSLWRRMDCSWKRLCGCPDEKEEKRKNNPDHHYLHDVPSRRNSDGDINCQNAKASGYCKSLLQVISGCGSGELLELLNLDPAEAKIQRRPFGDAVMSSRRNWDPMGENVKEEEKKGPTARQVGGTYQRHQNSLPECGHDPTGWKAPDGDQPSRILVEMKAITQRDTFYVPLKAVYGFRRFATLWGDWRDEALLEMEIEVEEKARRPWGWNCY